MRDDFEPVARGTERITSDRRASGRHGGEGGGARRLATLHASMGERCNRGALRLRALPVVEAPRNRRAVPLAIADAIGLADDDCDSIEDANATSDADPRFNSDASGPDPNAETDEDLTATDSDFPRNRRRAWMSKGALVIRYMNEASEIRQQSRRIRSMKR